MLDTVRRIYKSLYPTEVPKAPAPIRFGILGAAAIAPLALVIPAKSHPEVVLKGVAARNRARAEKFAKTHGIERVYDTYDELLQDPEIDAVYNPLPNGLHYEWTMKALAAGKHVLCEKPMANTAEEVREMFALAEEKNLVLLEAFHYRFHPSSQRAKAILDSGELGAIKSTEVFFTMPSGFVPKNDIRYVWSLGGGVLMDPGSYAINIARYLTGADPTTVLAASHEPPPFPTDGPVDQRTTASLAFPHDATALFHLDFARPLRWGLIPHMPEFRALVKCDEGEVELTNFVFPSMYHNIYVRPKGKAARTEKAYTFSASGVDSAPGEDWWMTYRYQLEAFVHKLKGRPPQTWVSKEDSIANMQWIENVYEKGGYGARPRSEFKLSA
ncbi:hypothetical protein BD626DRAFT_517994 [Schizophyllum amplum]|uniref:D-xylose 1-dehydrogenase (NADP(+), D-xylono-1,5-lactone-forming) n=1 Tax=Schizophyllum amplum TaxID=97359 RepID=A0A550BVV0_9AGAR|nr:hypothetical protein BD626DRAFT_517994 [Auriculariopsis ampla]